MILRAAGLAACCILAACAGMDPVQCRSVRWYDLGYRDGLLGLRPQDPVYASQCGRGGIAVDAGEYARGWLHGTYEYQNRIDFSFD